MTSSQSTTARPFGRETVDWQLASVGRSLGGRCGLATQAESRNQASVALDVVLPNVVEESAPTTNKLHEAPPGVVVTLVHLQMLRQVGDTLAQDSDLHLR